MKIILSHSEKKEILISMLSNGALETLSYSGIECITKPASVKSCWEESIVEDLFLDREIKFKDFEYGGFDEVLTFNKVNSFFEGELTVDLVQNIINILGGTDDATDGYNLLQILLYNEIIFG